MAKDSTYAYNPKVTDFSLKGFTDTLSIQPAPPKLKLRVVNKESRALVDNAVVLVLDAKKRKTLYRGILKGGEVDLEIDYSGLYVIAGLAQNHFSDRKTLNMQENLDSQLIELDVELVELKPGAKLVAENINFATNSAELTKSSFTEIDQVIEVMKQNTQFTIEIAAHTDDVGGDEANLKLSDSRAKSVMDYMISKGIPANRLVPKGYAKRIQWYPIILQRIVHKTGVWNSEYRSIKLS